MASMSGIVRNDIPLTTKRLTDFDLTGQHAVIMGGTNGIGRGFAKLLTKQGAQVTVIGQTFRDADNPKLTFVKADLSSMKEAKKVAQSIDFSKVDTLIFTTGIMAATQRQETTEGLEKDLAVSYLNRLAFVNEMAPRLGTALPSGSPKPRVFVMGFPGTEQLGDESDLNAEKVYKAFPVHMNTVAGNEILVLTSSKKYPKLNFYGLNPGLLKTDIRGNFLGKGSLKFKLIETLIGLLTPSVESYAGKILPVMLSKELEAHSPVMFNAKGKAIHASVGLTEEKCEAFIKASEALLRRVG